MYYELNMAILEEYRKALYQKIQDLTDSVQDHTISVSSIPSRTEEKALLVETDRLLLRLNSLYNPGEEARRWAGQYQSTHLDTVFVMFGLGNGIFLNELSKETALESKIIIYEPSYKIFQHVLNEYDMSDILKNDKIYIVIQGLNGYEFPYLISETLTWMNLLSKKECCHPGYERLFPEDYQTYQRLIQDNTFNNIIARNTCQVLGKAAVDSALANLPFILNSNTIWELNEKLPKDIPVIIAAAGPSLSKNIDVLKQAKGKAIIIAVDRAYESFLDRNIEPDFIATLDSAKPMKYCSNEQFTVPLICRFEASPAIMETHRGKKFIFSCEDFIKEIYKKTGITFQNIVSGASVATAAFSVSLTLGFHRIVMIGQDLAYMDGLSHAGAIQDNPNIDTMEIYVDGINGGKVRSRHDWYTFLRWFENVIRQIPEYDIIDATEGGARIEGTRIMTLQEVVDQYCTKSLNCEEVVNGLKPTYSQKDIPLIKEYLDQAIQDLKTIKELSGKALQSCEEFNKHLEQENYTDQERHDFLESITKINSEIENKPVYLLIDSYLYGAETNSLIELTIITKDKKYDDQFSLKKTTEIYRAVISACDYIEPHLLKAERSITGTGKR